MTYAMVGAKATEWKQPRPGRYYRAYRVRGEARLRAVILVIWGAACRDHTVVRPTRASRPVGQLCAALKAHCRPAPAGVDALGNFAFSHTKAAQQAR